MTMPEPEAAATPSKKRAADSATVQRREPKDGDLEKIRSILFGEQSQQIEQAVHELREQTGQAVSALRAELQQLREELDQRCETLSAVVKEAVDELRDNKLDRQQLSDLLSGLAHQLNGGQDGKKSARIR